jgi:SAM-dependent methyltransferase
VKRYYDERAREYDDWWEGTGLFASRDRPGWGEEREALRTVLRSLAPGPTLDVACGTAYLTRELRGPVVGFDQSPRMLAQAGDRLPRMPRVRGDATSLPFRADAFGRVFTAHFVGHLDEETRDRFVAEAWRVAPELVVVDAALRAGVEPEEWQTRTLEDGTRWTIYKRFFTPEVLLGEIGPGRVLHAGRWFVVTVHPRP